MQAPGDLAPRYNIALSQNAPVVVNLGERVLDLYRWGLIPSWAKDPSIGSKMINAWAETITGKPINIKASKAVKFKAAPSLKRSL